MAFDKDRLSDYIEVNERVMAFYEECPDGSLQSEIVRFDDKVVVVKAWAYRTPDDARPGMGHSMLQIPGTTPYTRGSELENAETSAWGRALAALGYEVRRGIASRNEIDAKGHDNPPQPRALSSLLETVACPKCKKAGAIIKGREDYGGGWLCFKNKGGCGEKFKNNPLDAIVEKHEKFAGGAGAEKSDGLPPFPSSAPPAGDPIDESTGEVNIPPNPKDRFFAVKRAALAQLGPKEGLAWFTQRCHAPEYSIANYSDFTPEKYQRLMLELADIQASPPQDEDISWGEPKEDLVASFKAAQEGK